jgi:hypothetical protein
MEGKWAYCEVQKNTPQYLQIFKFKEIYMTLKYIKPLTVALLLSVLSLTISSAMAGDLTDTKGDASATVPAGSAGTITPGEDSAAGRGDANPEAIETTSPVVSAPAKAQD